jgi:hypothetical protein
MAPRHHPAPLYGGVRKALKKELSKSRAVKRREAMSGNEGSKAAFTVKDYVTIGISLIALATTLIFNVLLKTDDIRTVVEGYLYTSTTRADKRAVTFNTPADNLAVTSELKVVASNTGNRTATIFRIGVEFRKFDTKPDASLCDDGNRSYVYVDNFTPVVLKAGEASVIPLPIKDAPIYNGAIPEDHFFVLYCLQYYVFTPDAVFTRSYQPLAIEELKRRPDDLEVRLDQVRIDWLYLNVPPFSVYHKRSVGL